MIKMKNLHLAIIAVAVVWTSVADCKTQRNHLLKKATTQLKPTKGPKNLLDTFHNLPAEDFEFIKQLDKQFNKFGNNVKIKIQKENRTTTKNIKRTIDGSLGYGYQNPNDQQSTYTFSKPKYQLYPYSQHDIPPSAEYQQQQHHLHYLRNYPTALIESDPDYFRKQATGHTSVEIQPSHSYEIKQTEHGYRTIYHGSDDHSQDYTAQAHEEEATSGEQVPVIVLRVPGPAKYASHLQALLQQYLEQRAAQYIQSFQEQEAHGIDTSAQQYPEQEHNLNAYSGLPVLPYGPTQAYVPQMYIQPLQAVPYYSQQLENPYANPHITQPIDIGDHVVDAPTAYHTQSAHSNEESDHHTGVVQPTAYEYHNVHSEQNHHHHQQHDTQSNEEIIYGEPHQETVSQHNGLQTTENFPDDKHTQVIFKPSTEAPYQSNEQYGQEQYSQEQYGHDQSLPQQYLPQTHVNTYRAPLVYHKLEQFYNPHDDQGQYAENAGYDDNAQPIGSSTPYANTVAITQRPAVLPHNYHAQVPQLAHYDDDQGYEYSTEADDNHLYRRNSSRKRQSIQNREDQMKKFKRLANRMKSRMTAARQTNPEQVQA